MDTKLFNALFFHLEGLDFDMTSIYQTYHLNLQLFMIFIPLRECVLITNYFVARGKQFAVS